MTPSNTDDPRRLLAFITGAARGIGGEFETLEADLSSSDGAKAVAERLARGGVCPATMSTLQRRKAVEIPGLINKVSARATGSSRDRSSRADPDLS